ncbi:MAG: hypothetical protein WBW79_01780 [Desulfocapsaceae bacterium]
MVVPDRVIDDYFFFALTRGGFSSSFNVGPPLFYERKYRSPAVF